MRHNHVDKMRAGLAAGRARHAVAKTEAGIDAMPIAEEQKEALGQIVRCGSRSFALFSRVYHGKASLRDSVKAKCLDCSCWNQGEVELCTVKSCPLWGARPYQGKSKSKQVGGV